MTLGHGRPSGDRATRTTLALPLPLLGPIPLQRRLASLLFLPSPPREAALRAAGSGSYGSLAAYSANRRRSLSEIALPALADTPGADKGYMGHDQFAVVENRLVRRFPVYKDGDTNAAPTGGVRQLQYKLVPGEAMWQLVVDRIVEY